MQTLTSNGIALPVDSRHLAPLTDSTPLLGDDDALRGRYQADGYLYLRGVLDPGALEDLRGSYFSRFDPTYLAAGTSPVDGVFSGRRPPGLPEHGRAGHPAHAMVRTAEWERFVSTPSLVSLAETLLGEGVRRLPRTILRHFDRSAPRASRAHTDFTYLNRGGDELVTMWIPIGDCPVDCGGLIYLERSHRIEPAELDRLRAVTDRPGDHRPISHDLRWVSDQLGRRWLFADYRAGDVAIHSPHLVHASLDTTADRMRLSADVRFQRSDQAADPRWLQPWGGG
ncbi:MAG: phytanoyl-CoA dioxygenase family protein, partial [Acidimicrobiaceae bacterium]|nr:phytanoyl-CoA dioxygenase family protein [Acidimicrobiaceae bacterium]